MKVSDVMECAFSSWYHMFRNHTISSQSIPVPDEFITYLRSDGIVLPKGSHHGLYPKQKSNFDEGDSDNEWSSEEIALEEEKTPDFAEFDDAIVAAIKRLGGSVFPKLNWSSPRDAVWVSLGNTLKCSSPADIYLLFKSSDYIVHDLDRAFSLCEDRESAPCIQYHLVLRRWHDIKPDGEFRCFVKSKTLVAISQRYPDIFFKHNVDDKNSIHNDIDQFFKSVILDKFPLNDYVFDVYRKTEGKVYLIDFNTFSITTDSLLFTWEELECNRILDSSELPMLRITESDEGIQSYQFQKYAMPKDFVDLASGEDPHKLIDLLTLHTRQQTEESDTD